MEQNKNQQAVLTPIDYPTFSFYRSPITNVISKQNCNLIQLHKAITNNSYKELTAKYRNIKDAKEAATFKKTNFDYVTFCGIFSGRNDLKITVASGYMVLDIDNQQNVAAIREQLIKDTVLDPCMIFVSPSGKGLKVVIEIDTELIDRSLPSKRLSKVWQAVNNYLSTTYTDIITSDVNGNFIDPSGCDLSRACFICHDPNCFINPKFSL